MSIQYMQDVLFPFFFLCSPFFIAPEFTVWQELCLGLPKAGHLGQLLTGVNSSVLNSRYPSFHLVTDVLHKPTAYLYYFTLKAGWIYLSLMGQY